MEQEVRPVAHPYGIIREGKVFLRPYLNFAERQIGEVRYSDAATLAYFEKRFTVAQGKVAELHELVAAAENKGSYLMKLVHLRQYLAEFDGLGDFAALLHQLDELEETLRNSIVVNRERNLEIKRALLAEAAPHARSTEWKTASEVLKEIKGKWIKTGAVDREFASIEAEFDELVDGFFARRKAFFDERNREQRERLGRYEILVQQAETLKDAEELDSASATYKKLHEEWKKIGKVPHKQLTVLWNAFRKASDYFYERYKTIKGLPSRPYVKRVDPKTEAQQALVKEAETLAISTDMMAAAERAKALLMEWKNVGQNPRLQDRNLANRFRAACDRIFELSYLIRVIKRKHYGFDRKPLAEQLRIRITVMGELVRKDKMDLELAQRSEITSSYGEVDKAAQSRLNVQKRKIAMKETISREYEQQLAALVQSDSVQTT